MKRKLILCFLILLLIPFASCKGNRNISSVDPLAMSSLMYDSVNINYSDHLARFQMIIDYLDTCENSDSQENAAYLRGMLDVARVIRTSFLKETSVGQKYIGAEILSEDVYELLGDFFYATNSLYFTLSNALDNGYELKISKTNELSTILKQLQIDLDSINEDTINIFQANIRNAIEMINSLITDNTYDS